MSDYNPALAFISSSVKDKKAKGDKDKKPDHADVSVAEKIPVPANDPAPVVKAEADPVTSPAADVPSASAPSTALLVNEPRNRRFQALFKPSVFNALVEYGKANKISVNEAIEQLILTKKHI